jgi:hypothetical protein
MSVVLEQQIVPAVIPYYREKANFPPNVLNLIYRKLCAENLDRLLFHNRSITEDEFVRFADTEALTSIFLDEGNGRYAGIAWLTNIEDCDSLKKGLGAFAFFKEYWRSDITQVFGEICLSQWFVAVGLTMVFGITPKPNRMAQQYCKRLGFTYLKESVPGFLSFNGETVDACVCTLTKSDFEQRITGRET